MSVRMYAVAAFSTEPFHGNPAVVCLLGAAADEAWLRAVAAEVNQPATAFVRPVAEGYELRWFTPTQELPLCGHGTLAAAHILVETGQVEPYEVIAFATAAGRLTVRHEDDLVWMDFPASRIVEAVLPAAVLDALGVTRARWFGRNDHEFVLEVESPEQVEAMKPDFARLAEFPVARTIVTARGGAGADYTLRVFTPATGVAEDQVTGSAQCVLGPLWAGRLGRTKLTAVQASPRRGRLAVVVGADGVRLGGRAVTTARGELLL